MAGSSGRLWQPGSHLLVFFLLTCAPHAVLGENTTEVDLPDCQIVPTRRTGFAAGGAGAVPWWGAGLASSNEVADRSLAETITADGGTAFDSPGLWGTAMDPGAGSSEERSSSFAEWTYGVSPETARFSRLGSGGPPTSDGRKLALDLSAGLACEACSQLLTEMWAALTEPSPPSMQRWISRGCVDLGRTFLIKKGWEVTANGCGAASYTYESELEGSKWCMLQDFSAAVIKDPDLSEIYSPGMDALLLACERTIHANSERVISYLTSNRNGTRARQRNPELMRATCLEAACCASSLTSSD